MPLGFSFEFPCVVIMMGMDREGPFVGIGVWGGATSGLLFLARNWDDSFKINLGLV